MIAFKQRSLRSREDERRNERAIGPNATTRDAVTRETRDDDGAEYGFDVEAALRSLTPQQARVLVCLQQGYSNKLIARALGIAEPTVKMHLSIVLGKLQCANRVQLAVVATRHIGLLQPRKPRKA